MARADHIRNRVQDLGPRGRHLLLTGAVVAVGAFLLGFGLTALSFLRSGAPIDVVTVPDIRQMPVEDASRRLDGSDLTIEIGDSFPNPTAPRGSVLAQSPLPGQEVSPGTSVRVILSRGQATPTVPDVDALPVAMATQTLQAAGFNVVVEDAPGEGSLGQVVGTVPASGTSVPLPATVRLRIGAPAPPVVVPTLVGMSEYEARATAENAGLAVGEVIYLGSDEGETDGVVGQDPPAGESAPRGSAMQLRVRGEGPRETPGSLEESDRDDSDGTEPARQEGRDI